jgi:outer membrane lipoprotein SlyB
METQIKRTTHPMLIIAAVSVTLFSFAGFAAIMGWIPTSSSHSQPAGLVAEASPTASQPMQQRFVEPAPEARPVEQRTAEPKPVAKPKPKPAVTKSTPAEQHHAPAQVASNGYPPVAYSEPRHEPAAPRYESTPPRVEAPKKLCYDCGVVESVRDIEKRGEGSGLGAVAGGVLGGVLGNQVGSGRGQTVMRVVGAAGGALAGHEVEKRMKNTHTYELTIRYEDGTTRTITQDTAPLWRAGDRVKVVNGTIQPNA